MENSRKLIKISALKGLLEIDFAIFTTISNSAYSLYALF